MEKVIQFLEDLAKNNTKEWFNDNRTIYEESKEKVLFITEILINEIRKFDPGISAINPKDCMFRIFRDVRFSKDKRPYKTNFGSFIAKGGRKSLLAGYYFHIEPGASFIGGGLYMPPAESLKLVRDYLAENAGEFYEIINDREFKNEFPEMYDHKLKTAPKGFPKDHEFIDLLRYKSFVFSRSLDNKDVTGDKYMEVSVQAFKQLYKVNSFLNEVLTKK